MPNTDSASAEALPKIHVATQLINVEDCLGTIRSIVRCATMAADTIEDGEPISPALSCAGHEIDAAKDIVRACREQYREEAADN